MGVKSLQVDLSDVWNSEHFLTLGGKPYDVGDTDNGLFLPEKATNMEQSQLKDEDMKTANSKIAVVGLAT